MAAILVVAGLAACGDTGPTAAERAKAAADHRRAVEHREARVRLVDAKAAAKEAQIKADGCENDAGNLVDALSELNSRLNIGLSYAAYGDKVADARVAYDDVGFADADPEDIGCISEVGLSAEKALNTYASAYRTWSKCFESFSCDNDDVTPVLQKRWSRATIQVEQAKSGLARLKRRATNAVDKVQRLAEIVKRTAPPPPDEST